MCYMSCPAATRNLSILCQNNAQNIQEGNDCKRCGDLCAIHTISFENMVVTFVASECWQEMRTCNIGFNSNKIIMCVQSVVLSWKTKSHMPKPQACQTAHG